MQRIVSSESVGRLTVKIWKEGLDPHAEFYFSVVDGFRQVERGGPFFREVEARQAAQATLDKEGAK